MIVNAICYLPCHMKKKFGYQVTKIVIRVTNLRKIQRWVISIAVLKLGPLTAAKPLKTLLVIGNR